MLKILFLIGVTCLCVQLVLAQSFAQQCVNEHNKYRKMHGVPNLVHDSTVAKVAQDWANYLAKNGKFEHRPKNKYGENLYAVYSGTNLNCAQAVESWYEEIKGTSNLGCGKAENGRKQVVVCNYEPRANYLLQAPENFWKEE